MADKRISRKDDEFNTYVHNAIPHLNKEFRPSVSVAVGANQTVNLASVLGMPAYLEITFENTGAPGAPNLYFCVRASEFDACNPASAFTVALGASRTITLKELGLEGENYFINVTNTDPMTASSCKITYALNWKRLGLVQEQFTNLKNKATIWDEKYTLYLNPDTRTSTITSQKNNAKEDFIEYAEAPLNIIAASINILEEDRTILNLPARDRTPSPRPKITGAPYTNLQGEPGCTVKITNRVNSDASRASIHPDADGVEVRWIILDAAAPAPASPADCTNSELITKAIHTMQFDLANAAKKLHLFARWRNNSEPQKSGPWTNCFSVVLS